MQPGTLVKLRDLGLRELWLQDWISADLGRLGLGPLSLIEQEQTQSGGGSLDILASNGDTYYSIEVQLGEVDASHGFRVFDYWARNRRRFPAYTHVAVLVAESAMGRYRVALEELAELTPLLVVELRCWQGGQEVVVVPELVIHNASVDVAGTPLADRELRQFRRLGERGKPVTGSFHYHYARLIEILFALEKIDPRSCRQ